jgi:hypothetical protein
MERSNQPPEPECCRPEGQGANPNEGKGPERLVGGVHREIRGPQVGVATGLSNSASKLTNADRSKVLSLGPNMTGAAEGEAPASLPGSRSVAREGKSIRNLGDPARSRRTNCEGQASRHAQRQEGSAEVRVGVGSLHSSSGQPRIIGTDLGEGGDGSTELA